MGRCCYCIRRGVTSGEAPRGAFTQHLAGGNFIERPRPSEDEPRRRPRGASGLPVLQYCQMSHTLTVRLTEELAEWLAEVSRKTGLPAGRIIRQLLEAARAESGEQPFLRLAGQIEGPADLSCRKGYSRK